MIDLACLTPPDKFKRNSLGYQDNLNTNISIAKSPEDQTSTVDRINFIQTIRTKFRKSILINDQREKRMSIILQSSIIVDDALNNSKNKKRNSLVEKSPTPIINKRKSVLNDVDFLFPIPTLSNDASKIQEENFSSIIKLKKHSMSYSDKFYQKQNERVKEVQRKIEEQRQILFEQEQKNMRNKPLLSSNTKSIINVSFSDQKPLYQRAKEIMDSKHFKIEKLNSIYSKILKKERDLSFNNLNMEISNLNEEKLFNKKKFDFWVEDQNNWKQKKNMNNFEKNRENYNKQNAKKTNKTVDDVKSNFHKSLRKDNIKSCNINKLVQNNKKFM